MKTQWKIELALDEYVDTKLVTDDQKIASDFLGRHTPMPFAVIHSAIELGPRVQEFPYQVRGSDVVVTVTRRNLR